MSLLLAALAEFADALPVMSQVSARHIRNYYLFNSQEEGDLRFKLILTQNDKDALIRLVQGLEPLAPSASRLMENYEFFRKKIREGGLSPEELFEGIGKLLVVDVSLDRRYDNPQLIFESLNSTCLDLSQADLIRNYILMRQEPAEQTALYQNYWFPMEQSFGNAEYSKQFDRFMRDYLSVKNSGAIPKIDEVYAEFKDYVSRSGSAIPDVVADIQRYSNCWIRMAVSGNEKDPEARQLFADLNFLRIDVSYPFLLEVYDDYAHAKLTRDEFLQILMLVQTYAFRRAVCGTPTNSLNKTFATLSAGIYKSNYLESVQVAFLMMGGYRRLPRAEEFQRNFPVKDIYSFRPRTFLLRKLENYGSKEVANVDNYTIEHIMPQNPELPQAWQVDLGPNWKEIQGRYLHTIGNLTLTGYNPELSDRPFQDKRDMEGGFRDSPIRLNKSLAGLETWNENEIQTRARQLTEVAVQIWSIPKLVHEVLEKYRPPSKRGQSAGNTGPRSWDEASFFAEASDRLPASEVDILKKIYDWSMHNLPRMTFGHGEFSGSFCSALDLPEGSVWPIRAYTDGFVEFQFKYMVSQAVFDDPSLSKQFLERLSLMEQFNHPVNETTLRGRPSIMALFNRLCRSSR